MTEVQRRLIPYGVAGLAILAAFLLRLGLNDVLYNSVVGLIFTPAILIAAMLGGLCPPLS